MNWDYGANNEEGECLEIFRSYGRGIRGMLLSDRAGFAGQGAFPSAIQRCYHLPGELCSLAFPTKGLVGVRCIVDMINS